MLSRDLLPALVLVAAAATSGCETGRCYGLGLGKRYGLTVVESYTAQSRYKQTQTASSGISPCNFSNLEAGDQLVIEIVDTVERTDCDQNVARLVSSTKPRVLLPGAAEGSPLPLTDAQTVFTVTSRFQVGDCRGTWELVLQGHGEPIADEGNPFRTPVPGETPPVTLHETFVGDPTEPGCVAAGLADSRCSTPYVVSFQEIQ